MNTSYAWPSRSHVRQSSAKFLVSQNWTHAPRMKYWLLAIIRPGRHPELPHSPSNKPLRSREVRFDKVVTGIVGLPGPMKLDKWPVQIKACHRGQNDAVLNQHRQGLPPWNLGIATVVSQPFPFEIHFPLFTPTNHIHNTRT
jgi:hypothetical protein